MATRGKRRWLAKSQYGNGAFFGGVCEALICGHEGKVSKFCSVKDKCVYPICASARGPAKVIFHSDRKRPGSSEFRLG